MVFFVVKIVEDDEIVVVPVHWFMFSENKCALPIKDAAQRAEREEVFNLRWPRYDAKVISSHDSYEDAVRRSESILNGSADTEVSDSVKTFQAQEKSKTRPRRATVKKAIVENPLDTGSDEDRLNHIADKHAVEDLAAMWLNPSPSTSKRAVQPVSFTNPVSSTENRVDPVEGYRGNSPQSDESIIRSSAVLPEPPTEEVSLDASSGKRKERGGKNDSTDIEEDSPEEKEDSCIEPSSKSRKVIDDNTFKTKVLTKLSNLFALTKGMGRDIQDIKSDNRDMRSQFKKNFQAKVDVSDKSHPVFTLSQKYSFPLKNLEDFKKFDDSLVDSVVNAIKEEGGLYSNVSLTELNKLSAEFVTKAGTRLASKKKKVVD
ncbi:hypothetical protein DAPPUDRAFT_336116 [Daphnia pulex]|uniref:Uncharacterized protein n=1 Tax=Daphnia pulex TaxID=6669 RepID=E9HZ58_DAPPU|nr:hypothetical protein DAPPUDRAFT_336116 [Daphnia pulex]|eukprot:EFX62973.1 hypothetical protein DAPPUDRAFT_336116 [Daphnia pulex]